MSTSTIIMINIDDSSHENGLIIFQTKILKTVKWRFFIKDTDRNTIEVSERIECIYIYYSKFMVSWWGWKKYFNNEQIQISDIENFNSAFWSSGSFGSIIGSIFSGHNTYTVITTNLKQPFVFQLLIQKNYTKNTSFVYHSHSENNLSMIFLGKLAMHQR